MIQVGDILLLTDTATLVQVIDGNDDDGWDCLNEQHGVLFKIGDTAALQAQATFGATPEADRPAPGTLVCTFASKPTAKWNLDGYATTPAFGPGQIWAVLTNIDDPTISCFVDQNSIFLPSGAP